MATADELKSLFVTGYKPTQADFSTLIDFITLSGEKMNDNAVLTQHLANNAVTAAKRTNGGEFGQVITDWADDYPNLVTGSSATYTLPAESYVYHSKGRENITTSQTVSLVAGASALITYDTQTGTLIARHGASHSLIGEFEVTLCLVMFETSSKTTITSFVSMSETTIDGTPYHAKQYGNTDMDRNTLVREKVYTTLPLSKGEFVETPVFPSAANNSDNPVRQQPHTFIYEKYDELLSEYPDWITKTVVTQDEWDNNIIRYDVQPPELPQSNNDRVLPAYFWNVSVHGSEKAAAWVTYTTLRYMFENLTQDINIENFLTNHHLVILPAANPSGWDDGTRQNRNGVDLNRNQPSGWFLGSDPTSAVYGGPEPLSEIESQVINGIIHNTKNLKLVVDYHNFFIPANGRHFLWLPSASQFLVNTNKSFIFTFSSALKRMFSELDNPGYYGYVDLDGLGGTIDREAMDNGIYGLTFETCENMAAGDNTALSSMPISGGVMAFLNWNLLMAKNLGTYDSDLVQ